MFKFVLLNGVGKCQKSTFHTFSFPHNWITNTGYFIISEHYPHHQLEFVHSRFLSVLFSPCSSTFQIVGQFPLISNTLWFNKMAISVEKSSQMMFDSSMVKVLSDLNQHCQIDGQLSIMRWKAWSKEMIIAQCSMLSNQSLRITQNNSCCKVNS